MLCVVVLSVNASSRGTTTTTAGLSPQCFCWLLYSSLPASLSSRVCRRSCARRSLSYNQLSGSLPSSVFGSMTRLVNLFVCGPLCECITRGTATREFCCRGAAHATARSWRGLPVSAHECGADLARAGPSSPTSCRARFRARLGRYPLGGTLWSCPLLLRPAPPTPTHSLRHDRDVFAASVFHAGPFLGCSGSAGELCRTRSPL